MNRQDALARAAVTQAAVQLVVQQEAIEKQTSAVQSLQLAASAAPTVQGSCGQALPEQASAQAGSAPACVTQADVQEVVQQEGIVAQTAAAQVPAPAGQVVASGPPGAHGPCEQSPQETGQAGLP